MSIIFEEPERTIQRELTDTRFCVPAALAWLTRTTVKQAEILLLKHLGDLPQVQGVYYPLVLKVLRELGFSYEEVGPKELKYANSGDFLVCFPGHVGCWDAETQMYYDNSQLWGNALFPQRPIDKVFKVWKEN